jgi:thiol-disulfide isomerase/thioredoxin
VVHGRQRPLDLFRRRHQRRLPLGKAAAGAGPLAAQLRALHIDTPRERLAAPAFALPSLDGSTIRLQGYHGQLVLFHFWATFCKPCREDFPARDWVSPEFRALVDELTRTPRE